MRIGPSGLTVWLSADDAIVLRTALEMMVQKLAGQGERAAANRGGRCSCFRWFA